jgi:hypothetical protein
MIDLKVGSLIVSAHRTVRVPEGRTPAALPPSLGRMDLYPVSEYRQNCPASWEDEAVFVVLHETEALWLSFRTTDGPVAILCGAGGVNALTGTPLGLALEDGNYMVAPPQPWIDGWKDTDGTVYQFVGTEYKAGDGLTVGEQILGAESKSGGIGLAVFDPIDRAKLKGVGVPSHGPVAMDGSYYGGVEGQWIPTSSVLRCASVESKPLMTEMGVGKGGKITQKIYPDPHGIEVWKSEPTAVRAIYLVGALAFAAITGKVAPPSPISSEEYNGTYFKVDDEKLQDVSGSAAFTGLKTVFQGQTKEVASTEI